MKEKIERGRSERDKIHDQNDIYVGEAEIDRYKKMKDTSELCRKITRQLLIGATHFIHNFPTRVSSFPVRNAIFV